MAEEVKIVDVAGGPAAEATLQELLKVMKQQGRASGSQGSGQEEGAKAQKLYNDSVKEGTTAKKENTEAVEESTSAFSKAAGAVGRMAGGALNLFTSVLGGAVGITTNLVKAFGDGTATMTDLVSQVPLVGSVLAMFTGYLDNTLTTFQQLSSSGASFNNNLTELRVSAAGAKVSLDEFASFVGNNTEKFAAFGGTVTQGAMQFNRARKALRGYERDLLAMGLTFEEVNEGLADYMYMNRAGARAQQQDMQQLAMHSAEYSKGLMTLSKLTGEDVKAQREKLQAQQNDIAFQMKLAKLRPEERAKVQAGLAEAMAAGGETGAEFFKQQFLGVPPLTQATRMFAATMGDSADAITSMATQATNSGVSLEEFNDGAVGRLADFVEGQAEAGANLENVLAAAAGGMEGPASELANILQSSGIEFTKYLDEQGNFNREALEKDLEAAEAEGNKRDETVEALTGFQNTLREIKATFEQNVLAPITKAVGPQLNALADAFENANTTTLTPFLEGLGGTIESLTSDIKEFGIMGALQNLVSDIGAAAKPVFSGMFDKVYRMIFGETESAMKERLGNTKSDLQSQAEEIEAQIKALQTEMPRLSGASAESAREQIEGLQQKLAQTDQQIAATSQELEGAEGSAGLFGDVFGSLFEKVKDMDWGAMAKGLGVFGAAIVALGYAAKPVAAPLLAIGAAGAGIGVGAQGIAAVIDSITNSIGNLADGVKKFENLDSGQLLKVGKALGPLTDNIMELAKGGVVATFVGDGALQGLADGVKAFESVDPSNLFPVGFAIKRLGDPIKEIAQAGFFANFVGSGTLQNLAGGVRSFENLDAQGLFSVGPALSSLQEGIAAFTGDGMLDSLSKGLGNLFSGILGGDGEGQFDGLVKGLKKFEEVNSEAIYQVGQGLAGISEFAAGEVDLGAIKISSQGLENLQDITNSLDATAITSYNEALENLVQVLSRLNEELGADGTITAGTQTGGTSPAGSVVGATNGPDQQTAKLEQLNNTMTALLAEMQNNTEFNKRISKAVKAGTNLQG